jgi:hypothetical protein
MPQLFLPHHYAALADPKPTQDDPQTRAERERVRDVFLQMDAMLWQFIKGTGWDLHRHRSELHYVSSHHFVFLDGKPIVDEIRWMWLHYGKSPQQLDFLKAHGTFDYSRRDDSDYFNAFYLHTRIQFFINASVFGCWLLLATDKNAYDHSEFLRRLQRNQTDRDALYQLVLPLFDRGFYYRVADERLPLVSGLSKEKLLKFVRKDRAGVYSGIAKEYQPEDPVLAVDRIRDEMIENLRLLYPIYDFMAWRPGRR